MLFSTLTRHYIATPLQDATYGAIPLLYVALPCHAYTEQNPTLLPHCFALLCRCGALRYPRKTVRSPTLALPRETTPMHFAVLPVPCGTLPQLCPTKPHYTVTHLYQILPIQRSTAISLLKLHVTMYEITKPIHRCVSLCLCFAPHSFALPLRHRTLQSISTRSPDTALLHSCVALLSPTMPMHSQHSLTIALRHPTRLFFTIPLHCIRCLTSAKLNCSIPCHCVTALSHCKTVRYNATAEQHYAVTKQNVALRNKTSPLHRITVPCPHCTARCAAIADHSVTTP